MTKTTSKTNATTVIVSTKTASTKHLGHEYNPTETNWAALTFPADPFGLTSKLRSEYRTAVSRCRGSDEKFQHLLDNLEILNEWARARLEADKQANALEAEMAAIRAAEEHRKEAFRSRVQAGPVIRISATASGFEEFNSAFGTLTSHYSIEPDEPNPAAAVARMLLADGRAPNSILEINAFGRPGIGSGRTLADLASSGGNDAAAAPVAGGLQGIRT